MMTSFDNPEIPHGVLPKKLRLNTLPLLVSAYAFAIYMRTAAPTIFWGDGIELSAVCATGGIAHPTGYPLFTMLGRLVFFFSRSNPAWGTNILCAFFGALSVGIFFHVIKTALLFLPERYFLHGSYKDIIACAFSLVLAFSRTFWFHSTTTEVYSLHVLFVSILLLFFLRYVRKESAGDLLGFFGIWGLSFSNHLLSMTLFPLGLVMAALFIHRKGSIKILIGAGLLFLLGLAPYIYLPLRAASKPDLNWGDPSNLKNFLWVISGGEFKTHKLLMEAPGLPFTPSTFRLHVLSRVIQISRWIPEEIYQFVHHTNLFKGVIFAAISFVIIWGTGALVRKKRAIVIGIWGAIFMSLLMIFLYNIPDIEPYFLSLYPFLLLLLALGLTGFLHVCETALFQRKINFFPFLFLLLPLIALVSHYQSQDKSQNSDAYEYGLKILRNTPDHAIIITQGDNDIYTLWYLQKAMGLRQDVTIIGSNFIHNGWYASYFEKAGADKPRFTIQQTKTPPSHGDFYLDLMLWVINPNLDRFPILLTFIDPLLEYMYEVKKVATLLKEDGKAGTQFEYLPYLYLYRLYKK